jgi:hypothetical protein
LANARTHVGVEVGDGLVARFGDALLLVVEPVRHRQRAEDLLRAVEAAGSQAGPAGANLAHRLAAIVAGHEPGTVPPFGAVAPLGEGYVVLLHGPVSAEIASPLGVVQMSGEQAVTWVDHKVEVALDRLSVTSRGHPVQVDPMSDLRAGLVPGSGFVITAGGATDNPQHEPVPGSQAAPDRARTARSTVVAEAASSSDSATAGRNPATTRSEPAPAQRSARSTEALGPPVGHLVSTDGARIPLDRAYVLGREPESDPSVKGGEATPVRLSDDENLVSRVHSYITVEAEQVSVRDAGSANGTFVAAPGDENWAQVGGEPVVLPPTWSIRVGNQVFTYVAATAAP